MNALVSVSGAIATAAVVAQTLAALSLGNLRLALGVLRCRGVSELLLLCLCRRLLMTRLAKAVTQTHLTPPIPLVPIPLLNRPTQIPTLAEGSPNTVFGHDVSAPSPATPLENPKNTSTESDPGPCGASSPTSLEPSSPEPVSRSDPGPEGAMQEPVTVPGGQDELCQPCTPVDDTVVAKPPRAIFGKRLSHSSIVYFTRSTIHTATGAFGANLMMLLTMPAHSGVKSPTLARLSPPT